MDESFTEKINEADVIFVNNFAFGASVNQALKERFVNAKEGAKIVSSLNFSPLSFTITERTLSGKLQEGSFWDEANNEPKILLFLGRREKELERKKLREKECTDRDRPGVYLQYEIF